MFQRPTLIDGICHSTCTSNKCARLVVHTNSTTSETVCSTNADSKYKFSFSEDPNKYYHGKMIEIIIVDPEDEFNNRVYVEVVDEDAYVNIKDVSVIDSLLSRAIKGKMLKAMDENLTALRASYLTAVSEMTVLGLNNALEYLSGHASLLYDLSDTASIRQAITITTKLEPTFLGDLVSKYQESSIEANAYVNIHTLCRGKYTNLTGEDRLMTSTRPDCYLPVASMVNGITP